MAQIPLGIGAYSRPYGKLPEIRLENRFFEQNPVGAEQVALLSRPGTRQFLEIGDGPIRTLFSQYGVFEGDLFIVSGEQLFRYSGGVTIPIDGVVGGSGFPVITAVAIPGWEAIFITDGTSLQYYDGPAGVVHELKTCAVPDDVPISDLITINSYVIAAQAASRKFFYIPPDETDIDALNFYSMEAEPDQIVNLLAVGDQVWIFGQSSSEVWYPTGDAEDPFARAQGRAFSQGILPGTLARVQDNIVVVGQDRVAYRIVGGPERISHHGIEEMLRQWAETSEIDVSIHYTIINERVVAFAGGAATSSPIVSWEWDFGDGNTDSVSGANPEHTYAALGTYIATLTVTAQDGRTGTAQRTIDVTTLLIAPTDLAGIWSRTSATDEQIALAWNDPNAYVAALPRRVYWNGFLIADLAAGVVSYVHDTDHGTDPLIGEAENDYIVLYYEGADEGTEAEVSVWSGPPALTGVSWERMFDSVSGGELAYMFRVFFSHVYPNVSIDLEDDYHCVGVFTLNATYDTGSPYDVTPRVGDSGLVMVSSPGANLQSFDIRLRAYRDTFGVTDYSPYAELDGVEVLGDSTGDPDGYQTCP
jgi:PKD repeat protein